jgi:hypothetical protein
MPSRHLIAAVLLALWSPLAASPAQDGSEQLPLDLAARRLKAPPSMDPEARRVISRAEAAYRRLRTLRTISRDGGMVGVSLLSRPRLYHHLQKLAAGTRVALAVSNGSQYYEYREGTHQYLERPANMLDRLALPVNVRLFFSGQSASGVMVGLDGSPTVREYEFRYGGKSKINGKPAERVNVSVMARSPDNVWHSFRSERHYDAKTGLLVRVVNGGRTMDIENQPNVKVAPDQFRWIPPAGSIKGLR